MWEIKPDQFQALEQASLKQFEDDMVTHLLEFAPAHARGVGVGEPNLRTLIRAGVEAANGYGFTLRGPVRFYVECMVMFGWKFDADPLLPWAGATLADQVGGGELLRADRLHEKAMAYREAVMGPDFALEKAAIQRLLADPVSAWLATDPPEAVLISALDRVWPERGRAAGPGGLGAVAADGRRLAAEHQLPPAGVVVLTGLMFAFGHGVAADPQFAWVADNLAASAGRPGDRRAEQLATRAFAYLSASVADM